MSFTLRKCSDPVFVGEVLSPFPQLSGTSEAEAEAFLEALPKGVAQGICVSGSGKERAFFITELARFDIQYGPRAGEKGKKMEEVQEDIDLDREDLGTAPEPKRDYVLADDVWIKTNLAGADFSSKVVSLLDPKNAPAAYDPARDEPGWLGSAARMVTGKANQNWRQVPLKIPPRLVAQLRAVLQDEGDELFRRGSFDGFYYVTTDEEHLRRLNDALGTIKTYVVPNPYEFSNSRVERLSLEQKFWVDAYSAISAISPYQQAGEGLGQSVVIGTGFALGSVLAEPLKAAPSGMKRLLKGIINVVKEVGPAGAAIYLLNRFRNNGGGGAGAGRKEGAAAGGAVQGAEHASAMAALTSAALCAMHGAAREIEAGKKFTEAARGWEAARELARVRRGDRLVEEWQLKTATIIAAAAATAVTAGAAAPAFAEAVGGIAAGGALTVVSNFR